MNDKAEQKLEDRIRARAYSLWQEEDCPQGRAEVHWDKARELVAIEDNQSLATEPVSEASRIGPEGEPVEPAEILENEGEFPTLTDQSEGQRPQRPKRQDG